MRTTAPTKRAARRLTGAVLAVSLLAAACSNGDDDSFEYRDPDDAALFELPNTWNLYEGQDLDGLPFIPFATPITDAYPIIKRVAFDGGVSRNPSNLTVNPTQLDFPVGSFVVRALSSTDRRNLSRDTLEASVVFRDLLDEVPGIQPSGGDFSFGNEYEGVRRVVPFQDPATNDQGQVYFISVTDPDDTRIFTIAAGCSISCWEEYALDIVGVVDSWLVNTKQ